jgi:hypothetical protein
MNDNRFAVWAWAFVAGLCMVTACEAGSTCHGKKKEPAPQPTLAEPVSHVEVDVNVETATPANVEASVLVNGQPAGGGSPAAAAAPGAPEAVESVSVLDARRNANRAARAAKHEATQAARAGRAARKAGQAAAQADVDGAVRKAYGN